MSVTVRTLGTRAVVSELKWRCKQPEAEKLIAATMLFFRTGPWDPYPDLHAAEFIVGRFGGAVVHADAAPKTVKGRIY